MQPVVSLAIPAGGSRSEKDCGQLCFFYYVEKINSSCMSVNMTSLPLLSYTWKIHWDPNRAYIYQKDSIGIAERHYMSSPYILEDITPRTDKRD
jgi:hypothetical protein